MENRDSKVVVIALNCKRKAHAELYHEKADLVCFITGDKDFKADVSFNHIVWQKPAKGKYHDATVMLDWDALIRFVQEYSYFDRYIIIDDRYVNTCKDFKKALDILVDPISDVVFTTKRMFNEYQNEEELLIIWQLYDPLMRVVHCPIIYSSFDRRSLVDACGRLATCYGQPDVSIGSYIIRQPGVSVTYLDELGVDVEHSINVYHFRNHRDFNDG